MKAKPKVAAKRKGAAAKAPAKPKGATKPPPRKAGKNGHDSEPAPAAPTSGTKSEFGRHMNAPASTVRDWANSGKLAFNPDGSVNFAQSKVLLQQLVGVGQSTTFERAHARQRREQYEAEQARLDLEERQGNLVARDAVVRATSSAGTVIRTHAETMPHRLGAQLAAAAGNEARCRAILVEWVEEFLTEVSATFAGIATSLRKHTTQ